MDTPRGSAAVATQSIVDWQRRIVAGERTERTRSRICFYTGLILLGIAFAAGAAAPALFAKMRPASADPLDVDLKLIGACVGTGFVLMMLLIAWLTKPESRADRANELIEANFREGNRQGHPVLSAAMIVVMLIALYGAYAVVESIKRSWVRYKLRDVDRSHAAYVMALTSASLVGVPVSSLAKVGSGQSIALNKTLALVMLSGWIDLVDQGQVVMQTSPTMRSLRRPHPLEELFGNVSTSVSTGV